MTADARIALRRLVRLVKSDMMVSMVFSLKGVDRAGKKYVTEPVFTKWEVALEVSSRYFAMLCRYRVTSSSPSTSPYFAFMS